MHGQPNIKKWLIFANLKKKLGNIFSLLAITLKFSLQPVLLL